MKDLRTGNEKAFEKIYNLYYNPVLNFLNELVHSMVLAEDFCQELFCNIWEHHGNIDPDSNFKSYLFTSAKNKAVDFYRKKKEVNLDNDMTSELIEEMATDDMLIATDTWEKLTEIVNRMPRQRRKIFVLSRYERMTNEEIAQQLHITKNAVEKHISFALRDIRTILILL